MKGNLKHTKNGWVIEALEREIPLYTDLQDLVPNPFNNYGEGKNVDFSCILKKEKEGLKEYAILKQLKDE